MNVSLMHHAPAPISVPAVFIADALRHAESLAYLLDTGPASLLYQYRHVMGYLYDWGHIIEDPPLSTRQRLVTSWRIVPVAVYDAVARALGSNSHPIPSLLREIRGTVHAALPRDLPAQFRITGCSRHARFNTHALFSLTAIDQRFDPELRQWIDTAFVPSCVPMLIEMMGAFMHTRAIQHAHHAAGVRYVRAVAHHNDPSGRDTHHASSTPSL
jgi:hypothetical protein